MASRSTWSKALIINHVQTERTGLHPQKAPKSSKAIHHGLRRKRMEPFYYLSISTSNTVQALLCLVQEHYPWKSTMLPIITPNTWWTFSALAEAGCFMKGTMSSEVQAKVSCSYSKPCVYGWRESQQRQEDVTHRIMHGIGGSPWWIPSRKSNVRSRCTAGLK